MPKKSRQKQKLCLKLPEHVSKQVIDDLMVALPSDGFGDQYLREEIFSAYCDSSTTPADVRRHNAITKWLRVERQNERTNQRLYLESVDLGWTTSEQLCNDVKSLISRILGPLEYPSCVCEGYYTNGASTRVKRSPTSNILKLTGKGQITPAALKHWLRFASQTRLSDQEIEFEEYSRLFTVPKKSEIDRVACKEPEINQLLQRSVGITIRQKLRKVGIDLRDQSRNQNLARIAVSQKLATIDLSSASDTITSMLVSKLIPDEWWMLLNDLRVDRTLIDGESHELEMFSSMGNGFTFELESLLFYAITRVVCWRSGIKGRISVYGDDIIAPSQCVKRLERVFHFLGFKMNSKKTHYRGSFRESCGKHYYRGYEVTPFYIRRPISTLPDLINLLNQVLEWDGRGWGFFTTPELASFHKKWSNWIPTPLHGGLDTQDPTALVTGGPPRKRLVPKARKCRFNQEAALTLWLMTKRYTEIPFSIDPTIEFDSKMEPIITLGRRTTWQPYLLKETQR